MATNALSTDTPPRENDIGKIIKGGYCVGCGACAAASGKFGMVLNKDGAIVPDILPEDDALSSVSSVCPFSSNGPNEDEIGKALFGQSGNHHTALGYFCATYAGHVAEKDFRNRGSSGGMGSWLLTEALKTGLVDTVLHVRAVDPDTHNGRLFAYCTATSEDDIRQGGKSRYYPITMDEMLKHVMDNPGRYALSGVPCFIKAVRRMAAHRPEIKERIIFTVGLICGHLKTTGFGESLAWQAGVKPSDIKALDFRHKLEGLSANKYAFMVHPKNGGSDMVTPMSELLGHDWGMGFFKLKACDFCDDVTAETADVSIGDAWLPEYVKDYQGTNVVVVRNPQVNAMIEKAITEGRLALSPIQAERVARSQEAGLRHRREGLSYRLWKEDRKNTWRPEKRVKPSGKIPFQRKIIMTLRQHLMQESIDSFRAAKEKDDLSVFLKRMKTEAFFYRGVNFLIRLLNLGGRKIKKALGKS